MSTFVTEISQQIVTIDGIHYTAADATASAPETKSLLQTKFRTIYGEDSFYAALADFLAEWFDGNDTLKVHTSGSTGTPKELWVEKSRMMNSAKLTVSFLNLHKGDSALLCMPLQYIAGKMVVVRALVAGLNLILVSPCGHPMQDLHAAPTFAAMIPMQVFNTLQVPAERELLMQVRHLIIGGGAIDENLEKSLQDFPYAVWSTYGMTETLSHIALRQLNGKGHSEWYTPFSSVSLSSSEEGTLVINAPLVSEEILKTNDIVEFNVSGQFRILGRKDNTINTGGIKVQIEQVEDALKPLLSCPFMITSVSDIKFGEQIVLLLEASTIDKEKIDKAIATLPPYWRPKQTICVEKLPQTETGKPDRANARKLAANKIDKA